MTYAETIIRWTSVSLLIQILFTVGLWIPQFSTVNFFGLVSVDRSLPTLNLTEVFPEISSLGVSYGIPSRDYFAGFQVQIEPIKIILSSWLAPIFNVDPANDENLVQISAFVLGIIALVLNAIFAKRTLSFLVVLCFGILIYMDYLRIQTWLYIYLNIFIAFALQYDSQGDNKNETFWFVVRLIVAGTWLWSGVLKFNPDYPLLDYNFIAFGVPRKFMAPFFVYLTGYISGFFEFILGFLTLLLTLNHQMGLFETFMRIHISVNSQFNLFWVMSPLLWVFDYGFMIRVKLSKVGFVEIKDLLWIVVPNSAICMHMFIIISLAVQEYEFSVLPWNFSFISYAYFGLFSMRPIPTFLNENYFNDPTLDSVPRSNGYGCLGRFHILATLLLFIIMPSLCLVNFYDPYFSFSMYTSNDPALSITVPTAFLQLSKTNDTILPTLNEADLAARWTKTGFPLHLFSCAVMKPCTDCSNRANSEIFILNNHNWGFRDTGASFHPSVRVFKSLGSKFCRQLHSDMLKTNLDPTYISKIKTEFNNIRIYITDKHGVPFTRGRLAVEYKCSANGLIVVKEDICSPNPNDSILKL